jgi:hypothetical protein
MKLSTEQIECIDQTIIKKGVKFDDLKIEILDHIASEIEYEMTVAQKTFPEAHDEVFERWNEEFEPTRALFSTDSYYPKLVRSKFRNLIKLEIIGAIVISTLLFSSFQLVSGVNARWEFVFWFKKVFICSYLVTILIILVFKFLNTKSKLSSTYKYSFDIQFSVIFVFLSVIFNDNIPHDITDQNMFVLVLACLFVYLFSTIYLGFKHYQFQNKFSIK